MDMDLGMDIASYSMANATNNLMQSVGVSMLSKTLDSQEMQGDTLAKMMEMSVNPNVVQTLTYAYKNVLYQAALLLCSYNLKFFSTNFSPS